MLTLMTITKYNLKPLRRHWLAKQMMAIPPANQPFGSRCGISASKQVHQDQTCRDERKDDGDPLTRFACERPRLIPRGNGKNNGKNQEEKCDGQRDSHDRR